MSTVRKVSADIVGVVAVVMGMPGALPVFAATPAATPANPSTWVAAWYAPPFPPTANLMFDDVRIFARQTVRQLVRVQTSGERLRVSLTNEQGLSPVKVGSVHVAVSSPNFVTDASTDRALTFSGHPDVEIPVGQAVWSDPVDLKLAAFQDIAISVYYPGRLAPAGHLLQVRISGKGDHGADSLWPGGVQARAPALASGVEVESSTPKQVLVACGDSTTEGAGSTPGTHQDYPEQLARRLASSPVDEGWVVINSGIGGNRVLHEGMATRLLDRFDRDVLSIAGVKAVLLMEGINDIGWAFDAEGDTGPIRAEDLINAYKELISRAHARGVKVFGGTITPYEGAVFSHPEGEAVRTAVNEWIRTGGAFDAVVDFDQAVRDPQHPARYFWADQSGDSLHPNDAGYWAMAESIDLKLFQ